MAATEKNISEGYICDLCEDIEFITFFDQSLCLGHYFSILKEQSIEGTKS